MLLRAVFGILTKKAIFGKIYMEEIVKMEETYFKGALRDTKGKIGIKSDEFKYIRKDVKSFIRSLLKLKEEHPEITTNDIMKRNRKRNK